MFKTAYIPHTCSVPVPMLTSIIYMGSWLSGAEENPGYTDHN